MSKKNKSKQETTSLSDAVNEVVEVETKSPELNAEVLKKIASSSVQDNNLDGLVIVAVKDGVYVPYVVAKNITDLITMDFVLKRETNKILDNVMSSQQK